MSAKQRADAEALREKYARTFGVSLSCVSIHYREDEDAEVFHASDNTLPVWSLGGSNAPGWTRKHKVPTW